MGLSIAVSDGGVIVEVHLCQQLVVGHQELWSPVGVVLQDGSRDLWGIVIQIAVLTNDLRGAGSTGGPGIDYIRLDTTGIEWIPLTFNMD